MEALPAFILAGLALAGSPGPANLSLAAAGAAFGARRCLGYLAGLTIGMLGVMGVTASGLVVLLLGLPGVASAVSVLAGLYFVYLAWRIATAPPLSAEAGEGREPSLAAGVLLSLVNPKGYAAMAALFSGFVLLRGSLALDAAAKSVVLLVIITAVEFTWLFGGAALTRFFRAPRASRVINVSFAILLLASVAAALRA